MRLPIRVLAILAMLALPAAAQEPAKLGAIPDAFALTQAIEGEWDDENDHIGEAFEAVEEAAEQRGLKLSGKRITIRQVMGLKTFKSRVGYLIEGKAQPAIFGKRLEVRRLPQGKAWMANGTGNADALIKTRRKVLDELEKPGVKRVKGIEVIEIFDGDPSEDKTPFTVYGPVR